jgi:hypothetical protein
MKRKKPIECPDTTGELCFDEMCKIGFCINEWREKTRQTERRKLDPLFNDEKGRLRIDIDLMVERITGKRPPRLKRRI